MSNEKSVLSGGQTINEEIGGQWSDVAGGAVTANSSNAAPNARAVARIASNQSAVKAEAGAEANAFEFKDGNQDVSIKAFGVAMGANAEAGAGGIGAGAEAKVRLIEAEGAGFGVRLGVGVSTGAKIGPGGIEAKVAGIGFSIGKKTGISVFDNELSVDFVKLGKALKFW